MEQVIYSNGRTCHISNARVVVGSLTLAVHNISSVNTQRLNNKGLAWGIVFVVFGGLMFLGGLFNPEATGMAIFGFIVVLVGGLMLYAGRPRYQVMAVTNAGQFVPVYEGNAHEVQRIGHAISQAIVSNQFRYSTQQGQGQDWQTARQ